MNRRTLLIGASALGLAAFAGGAYVLNQRRAAEAEADAAGRGLWGACPKQKKGAR